MQTAVISYRVADFLKQYPPFQYMEEADLLDLAGRGRVKFHESDEFIVWQGAPHSPFVFVIQQGTVSLWEAVDGSEQLRDMRGPGDLLGLDRFHGSTASKFSAKASSEVMIYALPAAQFGAVVEKYPPAQRYVAAQDSVTANYAPAEQRKPVHETLLFDLIPASDPPKCSRRDTIREAAKRMSKAGAEAILVTDPEGSVAGALTADDLIEEIGNGLDPGQAVEALIGSAPRIVPADATVSEAVVALGAVGAAVIMQSGQVHGLVSAADLAPAFGDHPSAILREIPRARSAGALRRLQQRARSFALDQLTTPAAVDWLAAYLHQADLAILNRIAELAPAPSREFCWCWYGSAGRSEALPPVIQRSALLLTEGAEIPRFSAWYQQIHEALLECGYVARPDYLAAEESCAPLESWKQRYTDWIRDPLIHEIDRARPLFDLEPAMGRDALWQDLEHVVRTEVKEHPVFVRLLANDCLSNLPPLTFFRDAVVDESGESSEIFDLERTALRPLVDVGRVFGIAAGCGLGGSTQERLRLARTMLPEREAIFREASETLKVVLYQQARAGIRQQNGGAQLIPSMLSHHDRQVLKSGFRSILRLLEFTAEGDWMEAV